MTLSTTLSVIPFSLPLFFLGKMFLIFFFCPLDLNENSNGNRQAEQAQKAEQ